MRALSELEGVCLGLVCKHTACTAYRVRQELKAAPSSHWQASAGSVYPLLARLQNEGLILTSADKADGRNRKLLRITTAGRAALKQWLMAGTSPDSISSMTDPVRSRTYFLSVLSSKQRDGYVQKLVSEMKSYVTKTQDHLDSLSQADDLDTYLGALGAVRIAEARLAWLCDVRKALSTKRQDLHQHGPGPRHRQR